MGVVEVADGWFLVPIYYFYFCVRKKWSKTNKKKRDNNMLFSIDVWRFAHNGMCNVRFSAICGNLKIIHCGRVFMHLSTRSK